MSALPDRPTRGGGGGGGRRGSGGTRPPVVRDAERSKARLLDAAHAEFAAHGLSGARVSSIVAAAGVNRQLLYHYFEDKERLYEQVLLRAYETLREGEQALHLDAIPPLDAIRKLIEFNYDFLAAHPEFVRLLNDENLHKARHLKGSGPLKARHAGLSDMVSDVLRRGREAGVFKRAIDPVDFYVTLASLCFFPLSNCHTLAAAFGRALDKPAEIARRRALVVQILLVFLMTPEGEAQV